VHQLLNHSANVNLSDRDNDLTPLQWAIAVKDEVIAKDLVLHGADVNVTDSAQLNTPLHTCLLQEDVFPGRFKELIRTLLYVAETNVNHQNQSGNTPLALAAYAGDSQAMELLLNRGCEVDIQNKHGSTPLMIACDHGFVVVVMVLKR
jgi:ankyrin repeat protein